MAVDVELLDSLARLGIFADLSETELEAVARDLQEVAFPEGRWVVRAGEGGTSFYVIVDGEAGVVIDDQEVAKLGKGSFFGEISILIGEATTADIVTRSPLRCLVIGADELQDFLVSHPRVMYRVLQTEARRLRDAGRRRAT
jgi:CRP/FNR family cyclic AMP-dependent transcriptional regulator